MFTLISYPAGIIVEAVIVKQTASRMRVVAAGLSDAFELTRTGTNWLTETGEAVQFEFLASSSPFPARVPTSTEIARGAGATF